MDCGDNSCIFTEEKGGMRTNGGCRCLKNIEGLTLSREASRDIQRRVLGLAQQRYALTAECDALRARVAEQDALLERLAIVAKEYGFDDVANPATHQVIVLWLMNSYETEPLLRDRIAELERERDALRQTIKTRYLEARKSAYEEGRAEERAAVVAWCRKHEATYVIRSCHSHMPIGGQLSVADALERGDHVQAAGEANEPEP